MRFVYFTHSVLSCWNNGNAHFLRGVLSELLFAGHDVCSYEPEAGWSRQNLLREGHGTGGFARAYPELLPHVKFLGPDLDEMLDGSDVVIVHEWTDPELVAAIGRRRANGGRFILLFHDTHHRAVTDPRKFSQIDLSAYDGVLAFGAALADVHDRTGWGNRCFVWHEAADTRRFHPPLAQAGDRRGLVWIGNWGDEERSEELRAYLLKPAHDLRMPLDVYGVRYPDAARAEVAAAGGRYLDWLANAEAPDVFARHLMTVHVPRRAYAAQLPGIPTIRVFEALACGIPLICAPWNDSERLFSPGVDYLEARTAAEMRAHMAAVSADKDLRESLVAHGSDTINKRHSCRHRVDELLSIVARLRVKAPA